MSLKMKKIGGMTQTLSVKLVLLLNVHLLTFSEAFKQVAMEISRFLVLDVNCLLVSD